MLREHFGATALFPILLRGPAAAIDRQGPELIRTLRRDPKVTTLSPWDRGAVARLRPGPRRALILADFHVGIDEAVDETVPLLERTLEEKIHAPVRATQTASPPSRGRSRTSRSAPRARRADRAADPADRPLARLPLAGRGADPARLRRRLGLRLARPAHVLTSWFGVDALALTVCTMMGLALGVDYCAADGFPLPRGAGRGRRPDRRRLGDAAHCRAHHGLRRQHAGALDGRRPLRRPWGAARVAGGNAGTGGRADRTGRHLVGPPSSPCSGPTSIAGGSAPRPTGNARG